MICSSYILQLYLNYFNNFFLLPHTSSIYFMDSGDKCTALSPTFNG